MKLVVKDIEDNRPKWWMTRTEYVGNPFKKTSVWSNIRCVTRICYGIRDRPKIHPAYPNYENCVKFCFEL